MNLRKLLRSDFADYIREKLIKEECEFCGSTKELNFHHIDRFHNSLIETLDELKLQELDTEEYDSFELECIRNFMLAKQIKGEYKTLCKECHIKVHNKEKKSEVYKENYYNPFGAYIFLNDDNIVKSSIKEDMLFRFLAICTYMNYDGYLIDPNVKSKKSSNRKIKYKDINEKILKLKKNTYYTTIMFLLNNNLLSKDEENYVIINKSFATKGFNNYKNRILIFQNEFNNLYNSIDTTKHRKIGRIIKLFFEIKQQKFIKTARDLNSTLGFNGSNSSRLVNELESFETPILIHKNKNNMFNPSIIYSGGLSDEFRQILKEFVAFN